ncbi:MAG: class I SAM-dependent methyltransferase [Ignavibacteriaceae bacterium]
MYYDPVKDIFASVIRKYPVFRIGFYKLLDIMFLRSWYVRRELRKLRRVLGNKEIKIFDAGTGYGQYAYYMAKIMNPAKIYAADVKEKWIEDCRHFFTSQNLDNVSFGIEDLTAIKYENEFDLIVCVDVMEHIHDDVTVFRNYYKALKQGGFLLINTPSVFGGSDVHEDHEESFIGEHARDGYSEQDFEEKLKPIGFTPYRCRYTYGFWGDKAWRLGIKYPMLMLNKSKLYFLLLPFYYTVTLPFAFVMMYADYKSVNKVGSGITFIAKKELS